MPPLSDIAVVGTIAAGTGVAAAIDVRTRRVPNLLTLTVSAAGIVLAMSGVSGLSVGASLTGLFLGMLLMLPGHALGATGAGDVKLLGAVGAVLGPAGVFAAFLYTAIAGGVLALAFAIGRRRLRLTLSRTAGLVGGAAGARQEIRTDGTRNAFPYGPAIAVGSLMAAWPWS